MNKLPWKLLFSNAYLSNPLNTVAITLMTHTLHKAFHLIEIPQQWWVNTFRLAFPRTPHPNAMLICTGLGRIMLSFTVSPPTVLKSNLCLRARSPQIMYTLRFAFPPCSSSFSNSNYCNVPVRSFTSKLPAFKQTFVHVTIPHSSSAQCKYFPSD